MSSDKEMLENRMNCHYYVLAAHVVKAFESINSVFQQANGDLHDLSRQLVMHRDSLCGRFCNKDKTLKILILVPNLIKKLVFTLST